ncbi:MAG: hypothetical protein HOP10_11650 [Chitinophagaceae bacterium]|nr:hypothetical protein [Chitinophagaceae bacterium]
MKKIILIIFLLATINSFAQDTSKVEQYCRLVAFNKLLSAKVNIDVDFGQERKFFSDNRVRDEETGKLKKFNTVTDALNYMGSQGWTLVNAFPVLEGSIYSYHYYFKKMFSKEDVK